MITTAHSTEKVNLIGINDAYSRLIILCCVIVCKNFQTNAYKQNIWQMIECISYGDKNMFAVLIMSHYIPKINYQGEDFLSHGFI